jgi:hypothetical protein
MHGRPGQRVAVFENVEIQTNRWQQHIISSVGSHNAKVGDIDGDGDPDIAGKNYEGDKRPRIWINDVHTGSTPAGLGRPVLDSDNSSPIAGLGRDFGRGGTINATLRLCHAGRFKEANNGF